VGGDDLVGDGALAFVVGEQLRQRDAVDPHVGVVVLAELRIVLLRAAEEHHLEPAVLHPAQMRHDPGHGHQW
jgi:hypothetical protein